MRNAGPEFEQSEPIFNVPKVVASLFAILVAIHAGRYWLLSAETDLQLLLRFAFIPARYLTSAELGDFAFPGGVAADVWSFVTYSMLHADWAHVIINVTWMLAFGSAVERRFGAGRFLALSAIAAVGGAALHLVAHSGDLVPMIGASAAISGHMGAAARFVFAAGGPLRHIGDRDDRAFKQPASPLSKVVTNRQFIVFVGLWFGINLIFGIGAAPILGEGQSIAWEAHIGGFLLGVLLFPLLDPVKTRQTGGGPFTIG